MDECGPVINPKNFIEYYKRRKGLKKIDVGDILVVSPISDLIKKIIKKFNAVPLKEWMYSPDSRGGLYKAKIDNKNISLMSIGIGCGEVAIIEEILVLDIKHVIFMGLAGGLGVDIGDIVIPYGAICEEGLAKHYIPFGIPVEVSKENIENMAKACKELEIQPHIGRVWTLSAPYREHRWKLKEYYEKWDCKAVEMEVGAVYALTKYYNTPSIAILGISDIVYPEQKFGFHVEKYKRTYMKIPDIIEKYIHKITLD